MTSSSTNSNSDSDSMFNNQASIISGSGQEGTKNFMVSGGNIEIVLYTIIIFYNFLKREYINFIFKNNKRALETLKFTSQQILI